MSNKIPLWVKYIVNDLFEVKPGTYKVKGQYAKDNLRDFHGWCVKNGSFESRYFKNETGVYITLEEDTIQKLESVGLKHSFV